MKRFLFIYLLNVPYYKVNTTECLLPTATLTELDTPVINEDNNNNNINGIDKSNNNNNNNYNKNSIINHDDGLQNNMEYANNINFADFQRDTMKSRSEYKLIVLFRST